ncbi:MAG: hypothetical protein OEY20_11515 [Gemmatimonadota bacterium]|nr:hypothetical protein [Gemmatimonadota bacterium]
MRHRAGLLLIGLTAGPMPAMAQSAALRLGVSNVRAEQIAPITGTRFRDGMAWSLDGAVGYRFATLGIRYLEGSLTGDDPSANGDLVEGEAILWLAPLRWAALGVGRHLRSYVQGGGTEAWRFWEIRGRGRARLTGALDAYAELWTVLGSTLPGGASLDRGMGMEGGLRLALGRLPASGHLRYRVERLDVGDGARRETVEQFGIAVGIGRR